jgi:simple sugar transport system substrate-binding protein
MITHAAAGDTFWDIVRKGAETAAKKDNVELLYSGDAEGGRQAQLVQQAIDQKVDGIVVTLAKPDALKDVVKKAVDAGIPVVSFNAGEDQSKALGAFTHFGQSDKLAGVTVGKRLAEPKASSTRSASSRNRATWDSRTAAPASRKTFPAPRSSTSTAPT